MPRPLALRVLAAALAPLLPAPACCAAASGPANATLPLRGVGDCPALGFGCGGRRREQLLAAIREGYRLFDTALWPDWGYWQGELASAIAESGLPREDFVIASKIAPIDFGKTSTPRAIDRILWELNTSYIDILITHHMACNPGAMCHLDWKQGWRPPDWQPDGDVSAAYGAMEDAVLAGRARAIGFSNVDEGSLAVALATARVRPAFVSNAFSPFYQDRGVRALCAREGVLYQGFLLLGRRGELSHPVLGRIAARHGVSPAQVVLRWALARNVTAITSSRDPERIRSNRQLDFALSGEEMGSIDALEGTPWPLPGPQGGASVLIGLAVAALATFCGCRRWWGRRALARAKEA